MTAGGGGGTITTAALSIALLTLALPLQAQAEKFKCPAFTKLSDEEKLFFDEEQCDVYWICRKGIAKRRICPDGLVFHPEKADGEDPCDLVQNVPDKCKNR